MIDESFKTTWKPTLSSNSANRTTNSTKSSFNKDKSNEINKGKTFTKSATQAQTTPKNRKSPTKESSHRSPIFPPTFKLDNLGLNNESKLEQSPQSKTDQALTSSERERLNISTLPKQSTDPSTVKIDSKNRFSYLENIDTEEPNNIKNKAKKNNPNPP